MFTLRECHRDHSYYWRKINEEMLTLARKIMPSNDNNVAKKLIDHFCNQDGLPLDSNDDYQKCLKGFSNFLVGVKYGLQHPELQGPSKVEAPQETKTREGEENN